MFAAGEAVAASGHHQLPAKAPKAAAAQSLIHPITRDKSASVTKSVRHSTFLGKTDYFRCPGCMPKIDKTPPEVRGQLQQRHLQKGVM